MARNDIETTDGISRSKRLRASASAVVLGLLTLTACSKGSTTSPSQNQMQNTMASNQTGDASAGPVADPKSPNPFSSDPAAWCASNQAVSILTDTIRQQLQKRMNAVQALSNADIGDIGPDFDQNFSTSLTMPTMTSYDSQTKLLTCSGTFNIQQVKRDPKVDPANISQNVQFTAQPLADKSDIEVAMDGTAAQNLVNAVSIPLSQIEAPAKAPAPSVPAQSTDSSGSSGKHEYSAAYDTCMSSGDAAQGIDSAMLACSDEELQRQNAQLNADYRRVMSQANNVQQQMLRDSERTWIRYRDKHCQEGNNTGGTMDAINITDCVLSETKKRVDYLEQPIGMILH